MKILFWIAGSLLAGVVAVIPEAAMYFLYRMIHPESELARIFTFIAFWFGGIGLCVGFGALGFLIFFAVNKATLEN
jgi:hypothetical protein